MYRSWSEYFDLIDQFVCDSEVSYAQGMNDLCSRFLEVLDSEVDTFWSFSCYMERFNKDFMADGLHRKIGEVHYLEYRLCLYQTEKCWNQIIGTSSGYKM